MTCLLGHRVLISTQRVGSFFLTILSLNLSLACTSSDFGGGGGKKSTAKDKPKATATRSAGDSEPAQAFDVQKVDPKIFDKSTAQGSMTPLEFYEIVRSNTTNDPYELSGYTFFDLRTRLDDQHDRILALNDEYPTMADYFAARESVIADITEETYTELAESADLVLNGGEGFGLLDRCSALNTAKNKCEQYEVPLGGTCAGLAASGVGEIPAIGACAATGLAFVCSFATGVAYSGYCEEHQSGPKPTAPPAEGSEESHEDEEHKSGGETSQCQVC